MSLLRFEAVLVLSLLSPHGGIANDEPMLETCHSDASYKTSRGLLQYPKLADNTAAEPLQVSDGDAGHLLLTDAEKTSRSASVLNASDRVDAPGEFYEQQDGDLPGRIKRQLSSRHQATGRAKQKMPSERVPGNARGNKKVIYFHIFKMGGTTMCTLAMTHGEVVPGSDEKKHPQPFLNCNLQDESVACADRVSSQIYSWTAVEGRSITLEDDMNCPAVYGIMLRDPISTLESYFNFIFTPESRHAPLQAMFDAMRTRSVNMSLTFPSNNRENIPLIADPVESMSLVLGHGDNLAVRKMGRHSRDNATEWDDHWIGEKNLEEAKRVLDKMDVVVILEEMVQHVAQFRYHFGWNISSDELSVHENPSKHSPVFSDEEIAILKEQNYFDLQLYEYAKSLAHARTRDACSVVGGSGCVSRSL